MGDIQSMKPEELESLIAVHLGYYDICAIDGFFPGIKGKPINKGLFERIARYSRDDSAALKLFADMPHECIPRLVRMLQPRGDHMSIIWKAGILQDNGHGIEEVATAEADTPALAICRAWLSWKEQNRA